MGCIAAANTYFTMKYALVELGWVAYQPVMVFYYSDDTVKDIYPQTQGLVLLDAL